MGGRFLFKLALNLYLEWTPASETVFKQDAAGMNDAGVSVCPPGMGSAVIERTTFCVPWGEVLWSQAPLLLAKTFSLGMSEVSLADHQDTFYGLEGKWWKRQHSRLLQLSIWHGPEKAPNTAHQDSKCFNILLDESLYFNECGSSQELGSRKKASA